MVKVLSNGYLCDLNDIVDAKLLFDKNLIGFIRCGIQISYHISFVEFC